MREVIKSPELKPIPIITTEELNKLTDELNITIGAIKFGKGHDKGFDILIQQGRLKVFPGPVYVIPWRQIFTNLPDLFNAEVEFDVNYSVAELTLRQAKSLSSQPGWVKPIQSQIQK